MSAEGLSPLPDTPAPPETGETLSDGTSRITSIQLSPEQFLAREDQRMVALIRLYQSHCSDGLPPTGDAIRPEDLFSTGMMNRTHCLRVGASADEIHYAVWAQDANFDGYNSLQNARLKDLTAYATYGILFEAVKKQLAAAMLHGRPTFYEMRGFVHDHYYYFTKAILPLRNEQGQIVKCLVPFTNKLADIPANLRKKFLAADID